MAEIIQNGYFNADTLAPWRNCADNELGESWICHGDTEPDFDREHWHFTAASLTEHNPVFLSEYNLQLNENDAVKQSIASDARASSDLSFWATCGAPDITIVGPLYAFVCYGDHTFDYARVTGEGMHRPIYVHVAVQAKRIEKVVICVANSRDSWYVSGITMPGVDMKSFVPQAHLECRLAAIEEKVNRLYSFVAKGQTPKLAPVTPREKPKVVAKKRA